MPRASPAARSDIWSFDVPMQNPLNLVSFAYNNLSEVSPNRRSLYSSSYDKDWALSRDGCRHERASLPEVLTPQRRELPR